MISLSQNAASLGFTLVELLVCVGILALLAALLLPVFSRVRDSSRRANCVSNLKQIYQALNMYAQDHRYYPDMENYERIDTDSCSIWAHKIYPYVRTSGIFECPSSPEGRFRPDCPPVTERSPEQPVKWGGSYDINIPKSSFLREPETGTIIRQAHDFERVSPARYVRPSSTILVLDGDGLFVSPGYQQPAPSDTATLNSYGVNAHHNDGLNVAFADGHIKYMSMDGLLKLSLWKLNGPQ